MRLLAPLAFCLAACLSVPVEPAATAPVDEADSDADTDADPVCASFVDDVEGVVTGEDGLRVWLRADWSCAPELAAVCDDLKRDGMPVIGTGAEWYLSGAEGRWSSDVVSALRLLPREAWLAG